MHACRTIPNMVSKRILMQGFFNFDWTEELMPQVGGVGGRRQLF
jgi:hypothetical protein